jgi:tetratricopeptide (TPR) repeat protein
MEKAPKGPKQSPPSTPAAKAPVAPQTPVRVPRLFRNIDWVALAIAFAAVWIVYFLTLAPELTLEDSGELCTGSFYAGIPHPPGYPFWAIYSWLWTKLIPFGNVAWRVELGEATAAAMACGLVALVVSRGSSMLMEGIQELKTLTGKWENVICIVSGVVSGLLLGLGGVMWSESVAINRISLFGVPWVMIVLVCLLRWIYAPHQRRYLYCAMFFFGICATIHQTLLVAAMGIEGAIAAAQPRLGRNLFHWNIIIYVAGWIAESTGFTTMLETAQMVKNLYNLVGIGSIAAYFWFAIRTKITFKELCRDASLAAFLWLAVLSLSKGAFIGMLSFASLVTFVWLAWDTRKLGLEWLVAMALGLLWIAGASFYFYEPVAGMTDPPMQWGYPRTVEGFFHALSRGQYEKANPTDIFNDPTRFLTQLGMLVGDIAGEFNWVVIFIALVPLLFFFKMKNRERAWILGLTGIYLCIGVLLIILMNPSPERQSADLIKVFFASSHSVIAILFGYGLALSAAYMATHYQQFRVPGLMLGVVTLVPAFLTLYMAVSHTFYGVVDPLPARHVFFLFLWLAGAFVLAALAGQSFLRISKSPPEGSDRERWFFAGYVGAALICLACFIARAFFREESLGLDKIWTGLGRVFAPDQFRLPVIAGLLILGITIVFIASLLIYRRRAPLAITLGLFAVMPIASALSHWAESEQRYHWFGYWFGHDMFTPPFKGSDGKPLYPEMARNTILFGGTDPGRFCPTYMIFCESFIPHSCQPKLDQHFDRRDVYLITQNALADGTYLDYLRAQYFRSHQHDPPFFSELVRTVLKDKDYQTNLLAKLVSPLDTYFMARGARIEKRWRTQSSLFTPKDFLDLPAFATRLAPGARQDPVSRWLFDNLSESTRQLITQKADAGRLGSALAHDLNGLLERELDVKNELAAKQRAKDSVDEQLLEGDTSKNLHRRQQELAAEIAGIKVDPLYTPQRFANVKISDYLQKFIAQDPEGDTRIRLNRLLLEAAYPGEIAKSLGGVYPDREIYIPSNEDSQRCFQEYLSDASKRLMHDQQFPNEPKQVKPGEYVNLEGGRVQVTGQVAVMSINGLLCKVIFDQNPDNEFYVEESFPLDWMYPHLTPFGVIMKINRHALPELSEDVVRRDHEFWSQYSDRLVGNWITYNTPVKDIVNWIEKVYLRHDLSGFTGDRKFVRDDQAQKAFSKLRSSIAGIYAWRLGMSSGSPTPRQYLPKTEAERERMIREADFAFRQAFAFCPYSPEAVFRYVQLLMGLGRVEDARMVAETCHKLDPENGQVEALVNQLQGMKSSDSTAILFAQIQELQSELRTNPQDFQKAFELASKYLQVQQPDRTVEILDGILDNPHANVGVVLSVVNAFSTMNNIPKVEKAIEKLATLAPDQPEVWFDLAAIKSREGKTHDALQAARRMLEENSKRLAQDPKAHDLRSDLQSRPEFAALRAMPEFKALLASNEAVVETAHPH